MMTIMMMKVMETMMMIMSRMMITRVGPAMMMMPEARRQGVTLWRLLVTMAHNCCKRQLQAEERRND